MKEIDYPYKGEKGKCKFNKDSAFGRVASVTTVWISPDCLLTSGQYGPVTTAVDATTWTFYKEGILTDCGSSKKDFYNHAVVFVGFKNNEYYKIRNSWGSSWGEKGHIRIAEEKCNIINDQIMYPSF